MKKYEDFDLCWCKSGKNYIDCHKNFDLKCEEKRAQGFLIPPRSMIKNSIQIEGIRQAGIINNGLLDEIEKNIKPRMTTEEIDKICTMYLASHNATSADYHYEGYPKHICTSRNDVVCHGIPSDYEIISNGDILNVDATTEYKGYYADASRMYSIGDIKPNAKKLIKVTKECLELAVNAIVPFETTLNDLGKIIERHAKMNGFSVVHEYCGHGVGLEMHEDPYVLHFATNEKTYLIVPGMTFTIEPMINEGLRYIDIDKNDGWTVRTRDKKLSAQVEHTIVVTENGAEILSK